MSEALLKESLREPELMESYGVPEVYIDGTATISEGDVTHVICYVNRTVNGRVTRIEVLRCHMSRSKYEANLVRACEQWQGEGHQTTPPLRQ